MALVNFKKGLQANLPSTYAEGTFYVATDERAIYLDINNSARIRLGDFQEVADLETLNGLTNKSETALYYVKSINCLAKYDGSKFVQINPDTGATGVNVTGGETNGITASYDPDTRKITLAFANTFLTAASLSDITGDIASLKEKVGDKAVSAQIQDAIDALDLDETYAEVEHTHEMSDVAGLETALSGKAAKGDVDALQETVDGLGDTYQTKAQAATDKQTLETAIGLKADQSDLDDANAEIEDHEDRIAEIEGKIGGLSGAMHFKGTATSDPATMQDVSAYASGDVVVWQQKEFVFDGTKFVELGDVTAEAARITTLEGRVDDVDSGLEDVEAKLEGIDDTVAGYVDEQIDDAKTDLIGNVDGVSAQTIQAGVDEAKKYADGLNSDLEDRIEAIEGKESGWDGAVTQATANKDAIAAIKDGKTIDSFADVEDALDEKQDKIEDETYDDYGAAADAEKNAKAYTDTALTWGSF